MIDRSASFADQESLTTASILDRFDKVFRDHDPAPLQELIADDCVLENTQPAPDGTRCEGKAACIEVWTAIATNPNFKFDTECIFGRGDRGEIRWRLRWGPDPSESVRGVNLMRVRDGRIIEALGYVKAS